MRDVTQQKSEISTDGQSYMGAGRAALRSSQGAALPAHRQKPTFLLGLTLDYISQIYHVWLGRKVATIRLINNIKNGYLVAAA